ncbi:hypothetical protein C8J56DRAFT_919158 [Mycena floridula]|nr:hypothetical protein C8J56DRAFT_919158 [Mycena floridula]
MSARIRKLTVTDEKLVRFMIGKAQMEGLATANNNGFLMLVPLWMLLSCILIQYMQWWPTDNRYGILGYLRPLPAFAAVAAPIIALLDWFNRPAFEAEAQKALRGPDFPDIKAYYSVSEASGLWILEYEDVFVGLIALDASESSRTAIIRHFYVEEQYRRTDIQSDLLKHALKVAYTTDPSLDSIQATVSSLTPYLGDCLRKAGFLKERTVYSLGVFKWKTDMMCLKKNNWRKD